MNGTASAKATNECVGKPGQVRRGLEPAGVDGEQQHREDERRDHVRRLAQRAHDRAAREHVDLVGERWSSGFHGADRVACSSSSSSAAPSSERPVFARKTSSSEGWCSCRCSTFKCSASSARTIAGEVGLAGTSRTATPCAEPHGSPKRARIAADALALGRVGRDDLDGRPPDARLQLVRRALGDDVAVVDDPDPVREDVGLLEVLRRQEDGDAVVAREPPTSSQSACPALDVEAGRRLVEEEDPRRVDEREREVEAALHAARVASAPCGRRPRSGRRARAARRRAPARTSRGSPAARPGGAGARGRSAAGRARPPAAPRRSTLRTCGPCVTTS